MAHALCFLVLLCFVSCCAEKAVHTLKDLQVQDDMLWWLKPQEEWELPKRQNLEDLLYKLTNYKHENGILPQQPRDSENQEKYRRGLDSQKIQRRVGCRIFFWKSFTSC